VLLILLASALVVLPSAAVHAGKASAANTQTVVSLTFDDGTAAQYVARSLLSSHGMHGTFYINSSKVGTDSYYMTWPQIQNIAADGNEIGGHTAFHIDLTQTDQTEAQRQVCDDRDNLLGQGFQVTDFAYPYGAYNAAAESLVQACGYNSARTTNQFVPPPSETIPPQDPYATRVAGAAGLGTSLSALEGYVRGVEQNGGGWAPLVFHRICGGCDANSITQSDLTALLDWLQPRSANGTVVKTVREVIGGAVQPAVPGPPLPPPPNGTNALRNASLEQDTNGDQLPDCWTPDSFGDQNFTWSRTTDAHSGTYAERVDVTNYADGDNKLTPTRDLGYCTPSVTPGRTYRITAWYKSSRSVTFTTFTRDSLGALSFWVGSPNFPASSTWAQASWVTPAIPSGVNGLTFGLTLAANGFLTVDDLGFDDAAATGGSDSTKPTVSLTAPASGAVVSGTASLSANASDNVAVDHVDFLLDGSVIGTLASGPFTLSWNSRNVPNGTHTISARAVDTSGNSATSSTVTVTVSNSTTNMFQNPSLESASGSTPTCWLLAGYGNNSFTWTRTSDAHAGSWAESLNVTAWTDGDRKLVNTQDSGACAPAVVPGHTYGVTLWYKSSVGTRLFAYYRSGGAWIYWTSATFPSSSTWRQATWSTPAVPSGATNLSVGMGLSVVGSVTMDDFTLFDNAPPPDTTPPKSTITCNGASEGQGCATWYGGPVGVALTATDDPAGWGVKQLRYTTDGSTPTATTGTVYTGPFSVGSTTTVKWLAIDNAGNAEAPNSQLIQIDTTSPSTAIGCNGGTCSSSPYNSSVSVTLSASDSQSGVSQILYTTDGTDPTTNGTLYLGAFSVAATSTIQYMAVDNVGNAEAIHSRVIQISSTAPTSTISCNSFPCGNAYYNAPVTVTLSASDGSSPVQEIVYTTDGSDPTMSNGTTYSSAFTVSSTTTVKYRAFDTAGNAEAINSELIQIDTVAPTSTISCNNNFCSSAYYTAQVSVSLSASDTGSGVSAIRYTTDGSDPTATSGNVYLGTFFVSATATVKYRAFDMAGNAEAVNSQLISIDTTPPTVALTNPASGDTLTGSVTLSATASDDVSIDHVDFRLGGQVIATATTAPYAAQWDSRAVADGTYNLVARAFDEAGNATSSTAAAVTVRNTTDTTPPTTTISCNGSACSNGWYASSVSVTLNAVDSGSGVSQTVYTTDGSDPSSTNGTVYSGAFTVSSVTTVKFRSYDNANNAEPIRSRLIQIDTVVPAVTLTAPSSGASLSGTVTLSATASDNIGVNHVDFLVDGTVVGTLTIAPYNYSWNSASVSDGSHTLVARAVDAAGNGTSTTGTSVTVTNSDSTPPASTIGCNGSSCSAGWYNASVSVTLAATDNPGGSGVKQIRYTTNGTNPTATSGTVYGGAFSVASTTTVKYIAIDNAGNVEAVHSQPIQIDTVAPSSAISCNGSTCGSSFYGSSVSVSLSATDSGGSGVQKIVYTTDGSDPTTSNGTLYSGPFTLNSTTTVKYRSFDNAGNAEAINAPQIKVDTTAPSTTISCNGGPCSTWYTAAVSVTLNAVDDPSGSGVKQTRYTTNGSDPTISTGTVYAGPFTVSSTTTVKYRSFDNVNNLESVRSQLIQIDGTAPAVALTAPSAGATVSGSVALSATASDNVAVDHVDFLVDGGSVGTTAVSPYTVNWDSTTVADGVHTISARAVDSAGNAATSTVSVNVTNLNLLQNPGLEQGSGNTPTCWLLGGYGTNTFTWTWTTDAHTGTHAENLNITSFTNGDRKLLNAFNGTCSIATQQGRTYTITAWYKSTAKPIFMAFLSTTGATGAYNYFAQSPQLQVSAGWVQASWTMPPMPAGATNLSVGLGLSGQAGSLTIDDLGAFRTG
jgi:peptidoglycan/xylan/chitin deacetylase (PgdA/CDA1 family)